MIIWRALTTDHTVGIDEPTVKEDANPTVSAVVIKDFAELDIVSTVSVLFELSYGGIALLAK